MSVFWIGWFNHRMAPGVGVREPMFHVHKYLEEELLVPKTHPPKKLETLRRAQNCDRCVVFPFSGILDHDVQILDP